MNRQTDRQRQICRETTGARLSSPAGTKRQRNCESYAESLPLIAIVYLYLVNIAALYLSFICPCASPYICPCVCPSVVFIASSCVCLPVFMCCYIQGSACLSVRLCLTVCCMSIIPFVRLRASVCLSSCRPKCSCLSAFYSGCVSLLASQSYWLFPIYLTRSLSLSITL